MSEQENAPKQDPERLLSLVGLTGKEHDLVGRLSGGRCARVSLATALLGAPDLLVLDEPTVGLDPVLRRELWDLFHRLAAEGVSLLVSSHVMDEASRCSRLLLMREGRIIADDAPTALLSRTGAADVGGAFLTLVGADASRTARHRTERSPSARRLASITRGTGRDRPTASGPARRTAHTSCAWPAATPNRFSSPGRSSSL
jgi:ABC-2 type transport system ATP-binding protein